MLSEERLHEIAQRYSRISREEYMEDREEPSIIRELLAEVFRLRKIHSEGRASCEEEIDNR